MFHAMFHGIFKKKFTSLRFVGPPPPTRPTGPERGVWFLNNTPMHQFGASIGVYPMCGAYTTLWYRYNAATWHIG